MSTQWANSESEQQWQQPSFSGPTYTGEVLAPGQRRPAVVAPGEEEVRLRMLRRWLVPLALVFAVISGAWWQAIVLAVVVSMVLRHRIRQLRYLRLVASGLVGGVGTASSSDLR